MAQKRTVNKKKTFLAAFKAKAGNISKACEAADVSRSAYYRWLKEDKRFARRLDDMNEGIKDWGEDALKARMQAGDTTAIIFYLKTKARDRGYVERQEFTAAGGGPLTHEKMIVEVIHTRAAEVPAGGNGGNGGNGNK